MATTGELQAIIEELQLIDAGDALSYLGEEMLGDHKTLVSGPLEASSDRQRELEDSYGQLSYQ